MRASAAAAGEALDVRPIPGGALVQDRDVVTETRADWKVVSRRASRPSGEWADLVFAWTVAWRVKSNTIVFAKDGATVGIGAGQMSRVDSSWIAARKAGDRAKGAVLASDAFFPFPRRARGGGRRRRHRGDPSRRLEGATRRSLAAAEAHGMAVVLTGRRHFRH